MPVLRRSLGCAMTQSCLSHAFGVVGNVSYFACLYARLGQYASRQQSTNAIDAVNKLSRYTKNRIALSFGGGQVTSVMYFTYSRFTVAPDSINRNRLSSQPVFTVKVSNRLNLIKRGLFYFCWG